MYKPLSCHNIINKSRVMEPSNAVVDYMGQKIFNRQITWDNAIGKDRSGGMNIRVRTQILVSFPGNFSLISWFFWSDNLSISWNHLQCKFGVFYKQFHILLLVISETSLKKVKIN